jgi:N-acyl-D-amino-acid deacylase
MGFMRSDRPAHSRKRTAIKVARSLGRACVLATVAVGVWLRHDLRAQDAVAEFDTIIRNGRVIDGTGNPGVHADVAIKDGKIAAIGRVVGAAKNELDARGLVVTPGFIDVHTHAEDIDDQPLGENFLRMGVTTIILGNCGASALNVGDFFAGLEAKTCSPNVATLIGHSTVRRRAMRGSFDRVPTPEELAEMQALTRKAMEDGALGLSTGLIYLPGVFAKTEEIIELARIAGEFGGIYATHQRSEGREIFSSLAEIFRIAREAKIRAHVSHLKLSGPANWHQADKVLAAIEQARAEGLDITQDQYAYTASSTGISQLIPEGFREGGQARFLERLADPAAKSAVIAEMKGDLEKRKSPDFSYAVIASYRPNPCFNGMNIVQAAALEFGRASIDEQIEMILEIERNGGASGIFHGMCEPDLETFMRHPNTMFASDSGVRRLGADVPHPRGYGNNARYLGRYVREKEILRLEDAIRKMTSLPAHTFQIRGRGEIREGYAADLVVFDPTKVADPSTFTDPHHYAVGFHTVLVNGERVVAEDRHTGARPGQVIRRASPEIVAKQPPRPTPQTDSARTP